jgi:hypothetical protein
MPVTLPYIGKLPCFYPTREIVADQHSNSIELAMETTSVVLQAHTDVRIFLCDSDDTGAIVMD